MESNYHWELNPHAPRLLLNVIPNYQILSTNMHNQIKEFLMVVKCYRILLVSDALLNSKTARMLYGTTSTKL